MSPSSPERARSLIRCLGFGTVLGVLLCASVAGGQAQESPVLPPHLALDRWDDLNGLPQNSVHALAQGEDGYLWVGTQLGLARFDGVRFVNVPLDSSGTERYINDLLANPDTSLWVATGELVLLRRGSVERFDSVPNWPRSSVTSLFRDSRDRVWIGQDDGGIAVLRGGADPVVRVVASPFSETIVQFAEDGAGRIWIGSTEGLALVDGSSGDGAAAFVRGAPRLQILDLRSDPDGAVWVGSAGGLFRSRDDHLQAVDGLAPGAVFAVRPPGSGAGWVVVGQRLFRLEPDGSVVELPPRLQVADLVYALLEDHEGSLWLGTAGSGLARIRRTVVASLGTADGLSGQNVLPLLEGRDGEVWIGTAGGGLHRMQGARVDTFTVESGHIPSDVVLSLAQSTDGSLWVGTGGGVARLQGDESRIFSREDGLINRRVRVIYQDRRGRMWFGGNAGLEEFDPDRGSGRTFTAADGLGSVLSVSENPDGSLWVGTEEGLFRIHEGRVTAEAAGRREARVVVGIHRLRDGALWLATLGGIARRVGERFVHYGPEDGLCASHAYAIVEDDAGRLWVSSNRGLYWLRRADLDAYDRDPARKLPCRILDRAAGMPSREANGGVQPAGIRTADGSLWFPTVRGVAIVDPAHLSLGLEPPPPVIEEIHVDGAPLTPGSPEIPAGARHVSFRFTGLSFISSERLRFRYRLEGYDPDWIESAGRRTADYTNLPPGRYRFRVAAANAEGDWSRNPAETPVLVAAHAWETGWFRAGVAGLLALAAFGLHRWRVERMDRRHRQMFELEQAAARAETLAVDARLRALRLELHPHFFFNTLNGISGLIRDGDQRSALDLLSRFADLTRATLQARDERTRPLAEELDYIRQYLDLERIRFGKRLSIEIRADATTDEVQVPPLLLQPLVENAIRHGVAKVGRDARLEVDARVVDGMVRMRVGDNGPGFDCSLEELPKGTGLRNVQERLHEIYGSGASIRRIPRERGTLIEILVPASATGSKGNGSAVDGGARRVARSGGVAGAARGAGGNGRSGG